MDEIVTIAGSPTGNSRSTALLGYVHQQANCFGYSASAVDVRDLNPEALVFARPDDPSIQAAIEKVLQAGVVVVATPIYKAAYTGILKAFLDVLPPQSLQGKPVLPIATGGSLAHLLVLDYALKPVLATLGATHILQGLYVIDSQIKVQSGELEFLDESIEQRLQTSLHTLLNTLSLEQEKV